MSNLIGSALVLADWDGGHMDGDGGWWIVMMVGMVLFWAMVIVGVVWLIRSVAGGHAAAADASGGQVPPLEVLERRFAEGSITVEEYQERRRILTDARAEGS